MAPKPPRTPSIYDYGAGDTNAKGQTYTDPRTPGVHTYAPDAPAGSVWFPKPTGTANLTLSTGALGQGVAALNDPESGVYNAHYTQSSLAGSYNTLPAGQRQLLEAVAAARGHNSSANGVLQGYIAESARLGDPANGNPINKSPIQLAWEEAVSRGIVDGSGGYKSGGGGHGRGGGGAYNGPVTRTDFTHIGEGDLRDLADQVGIAMVGRGITDKEFNNILKQVRGVENAKPQVTHSTPSGHDVVSSTTEGVSNADRQDVVQKILAQNPEYGDYQKATTMMDWFDNALKGRQNGG